uniref:Uncharacterized protein n=1 Tax=Caenorhabditis japonica TaxID=281687 RepID=A0A8R1J0B1_CAEJA
MHLSCQTEMNEVRALVRLDRRIAHIINRFIHSFSPWCQTAVSAISGHIKEHKLFSTFYDDNFRGHVLIFS